MVVMVRVEGIGGEVEELVDMGRGLVDDRGRVVG